jgi:hypothetical protein
MEIYIVQDSDLGCDNVVAVFTKEQDAINCVEDRGDACFYTYELLDDSDYEDGIYVG